MAIAAYTAALEVYTRDAFPQQWAQTQNNLGNAYRGRIRDDKAQNLELAIAAYTAALEVYTRDAFPQQWVQTQNNLENAYRNTIRDGKAENLEQAIKAYSAALEVYTPDAFPQQWAQTQNNLENAYRNRIRDGKAENLEQAIKAYSAALEVYTPDAFPQQWAQTQNNLENAYRNRIRDDKAENLEQAIKAYSAALEVCTRDAFPSEWAQTQNNLGTAYCNRIRGDKTKNLEQAVKAYSAALEVYTCNDFPQKYLETLFNLSIVYQQLERWISAYITLESAIDTILQKQIVSGNETKHEQAKEWNKLYPCIIEVCLKLEEYTKAFKYMELSKTQTLMKVMLPKIESDIKEEKNNLKESEEKKGQTLNLKRLNQLLEQREQLMLRNIGEPIKLSDIQNLLKRDKQKTAIIQWYIFSDCFRAFIITSDNENPVIWKSKTQDLENLHKWWKEYLQLYFKDKALWRHCLNEKLSQLAEILHIQEILDLLSPKCNKVIFIPHLYLHLLPLHALPILKQREETKFFKEKTDLQEHLIDKFSEGIIYAPCCQLLRFTQIQAKRLSSSKSGDLFAIQNPTGNLDFADIEVETMAAKFKQPYILKKSKATAAALMQPQTAKIFRDAHWLHFSCHGYFDFNFPKKSALQLADSYICPLTTDADKSRYLRVSDNAGIDLEKCLTLENIFQLSLPNCRLVTLSACETGLVDFANSSDEYIGLPSGFIHAGAASIVSSLWAVDDFSTALLMIRFYENLQKDSNQNVPLALKQAQQWFRQVTQVQLLQWLDCKIDMDAQQKQKVKERLEKNYKPEERPFKKPLFWAGFCAIGE